MRKTPRVYNCHCTRCGVAITDAKSGNRRYCHSCFVEINRVRNRENKQRRRGQGLVVKQDEWFTLIDAPDTMGDLIGRSFSALEIGYGLEPSSAWVDDGAIFSKNGNWVIIREHRMEAAE